VCGRDVTVWRILCYDLSARTGGQEVGRIRIGERSAWIPSMLGAEDDPCGSTAIGGHHTRRKPTVSDLSALTLARKAGTEDRAGPRFARLSRMCVCSACTGLDALLRMCIGMATDLYKYSFCTSTDATTRERLYSQSTVCTLKVRPRVLRDTSKGFLVYIL
jgi:hypothetical protein